MTYEERTWSLGSASAKAEANETPLCIWDGGNKVWELYSSGDLRHYRVISRTFLNAEQTRMKEILERLEECAIPREIYGKHLRTDLRWSIVKESEPPVEVFPQVWELSPLANWIPSTALHRDLSVG